MRNKGGGGGRSQEHSHFFYRRAVGHNLLFEEYFLQEVKVVGESRERYGCCTGKVDLVSRE